MRKPLIVANWKMHGTQAFVRRFTAALEEGKDALRQPEAEAHVVICPPFPYLLSLVEQLGTGLSAKVLVGAQDVNAQKDGAFTGEVSVSMLSDCNARYVIVGHSERRQLCAESDLLVAQKFAVAQIAGLTPILCVGETLRQREQGLTLDVIAKQLQSVAELPGVDMTRQLVVAYEPVWAIGSGNTATPQQAQEVHHFIREQLGAAGPRIQLLYGGSVKSTNAESLFAEMDIDGALVGGASLEAQEFLNICRLAGAICSV